MFTPVSRITAAIPLTINSEVFTLEVTGVDRSKVAALLKRRPLRLVFRLFTLDNRASPRCVYWKHKFVDVDVDINVDVDVDINVDVVIGSPRYRVFSMYVLMCAHVYASTGNTSL